MGKFKTYTIQWAAVRTHLSSTSTPPQISFPRNETDTTQGHFPSGDIVPPTMNGVSKFTFLSPQTVE